MSAGASALREARKSELRIAAYERRLLDERARATAFHVASRTESEVATRLRAMDAWGWRVLEDRRWPGTRAANIDLILIGPGGVLVIDVKCWAEPDIIDGHLYRGQSDADDEVDKVRRQADLVLDAVAHLGLAPGEVVPIMVFVGQRSTDTQLGRVRVLDEHSLVPWATRRGPRLGATQVDDLCPVLDVAFPPSGEVRPAPISVVVPEPVLPIGRHEQVEPEMLFDLTALESAILEHELAKPIEDWMTFLHPEQARIVRRLGPGPSRIRGAAGTGKTVVALHRMALLAEAVTRPILFTTFVKTLPPVLGALYERMSPTTADRVEFVNLHAWASQFLSRRGQRRRIDSRFIDVAYGRAWSRRGKDSSLSDVGTPWRYWRDEIDHVIKGRGITDFADYAALRRVGRRTRLSAAHREIVWSIYAEYEAQLRAEDVIDYNDLLTLALAELQATPLDEPYGAVLADEVQDLNCQAVRLLAALAGGGERLLLVGDGQQQIYPGGYTLAEAGISVAGRSSVLKVNYRNGADILAVATQVVADDGYDDLEDVPESGQRETTTARPGGTVWQTQATSVDDLRARAIAHVQHLLVVGHEPEGIAILCATNAEVGQYSDALARVGVPVMGLAKYDGRPVNAVKVGTIQRAKGLEFKHVVHPVRDRPPPKNGSDDALAEARATEHRTLFVAMTRARDTLWIGRVG